MKRSKFSLSKYRLFSMDMGYLVPCGLTEVLPGDTIQMATNMLVRVAPLVAPVMHPCHVRIHHWFVPNRLVWEDWEDFITGGEDGMDSSEFPFIQAGSTGHSVGSVPDYYGIPPEVPNIQYSALPFRGYKLIYNEWYRDQDLISKAPMDITSGEDTTTSLTLSSVAWEKDYFTTARPWTQKGPQVTLPLSGNAPVTGIGFDQAATGPSGSKTVMETDGGTATYNPAHDLGNPAGMFASMTGKKPNIFADLTQVNATSINDLRLAFALQRYEEARARYGSRYTEYLRYLGVRSSDARLQRPEYLGGGKQTLQFSEVLQTSPTTSGDTEGVGNLKGHGIGALRSNRFRRFFEEHGFIHSFISVKPRTIYSQGLERHFNRRVKEDFYQRELQHIGQQEILNKEIYAADPAPNGTFGFQDRYDEYRRSESGVAGEFRTTLNYWHMAREFSAAPVLNASFINANPTNRIFADQTGSHTLYIMASHSIQARRMLAAAGTSYIY